LLFEQHFFLEYLRSQRCQSLLCVQAMYPWRRIFKGLFQHDRTHGQLYSMRQRDTRGRPVVVSKLGKRLNDAGADWQRWTKSLAGLLEVLEDEMPTLPSADVQVTNSPTIYITGMHLLAV
jgi:hypothetical protein